MTPCIVNFAKTLESTGTDPTIFTWFDVSSAVKEELDDVDIESINNGEITKTYKIPAALLDQPPPFPGCVFVGSHIVDGVTYESMIVVSGVDPRTEPVTISGVRKNTAADGRAGYLSLPAIQYEIEKDGNFNAILISPPKDPKAAARDELKSGLALLGIIYKHLAVAATPVEGYRPIAKPGFINQQRKKKKKPRFYDWTTVLIKPPVPRAEAKGGTHASPRHHERRGHMRKTRSGKQVWVRNCKVGNPANGTVFHDYMVK